MKKKGFSAEQIIGKLREAEVFLIQGSPVGEVSRKLGGHGADLLPVEARVWRDAAGSGPKAEGVGQREAQEAGGRSDSGECDPQGGDPGKLLSPSRRRKAVRYV